MEQWILCTPLSIHCPTLRYKRDLLRVSGELQYKLCAYIPARCLLHEIHDVCHVPVGCQGIRSTPVADHRRLRSHAEQGQGLFARKGNFLLFCRINVHVSPPPSSTYRLSRLWTRLGKRTSTATLAINTQVWVVLWSTDSRESPILSTNCLR